MSTRCQSRPPAAMVTGNGMAYSRVVEFSAGSSPAPNGHRVQCQQCSFTTPRPSHLERHQRIHTGERPFQCSHCGKAFAEKGNLVTHLLVHMGECPYQCYLCPSAFAKKTTLDRHVHTHTGERPLCGCFCPMAFKHHMQKTVHIAKEHSHLL